MMLLLKTMVISLALAMPVGMSGLVSAQESGRSSDALMSGNSQAGQVLTEEVPPGALSQGELAAPVQNSPQQNMNLDPAVNQVAGDNSGSLNGITNRSININWWLAAGIIGLVVTVIGLAREYLLAVGDKSVAA